MFKQRTLISPNPNVCGEKLHFFHCINFPASRIRYEITRGNFGGAFAVKNMTGAIFVAGPLDYETRRRVSFKDSPSPDY